MCLEKDYVKTITCPHLKSSADEALCSVMMDQIMNLVDAEIRFCTSRHYEACYIYVKSIRRSGNIPVALPSL